jgi:hypothetical protein
MEATLTAIDEARELGTWAAKCDVKAAIALNPETRKLWEDAARGSRELQMICLEEANEGLEPIRSR